MRLGLSMCNTSKLGLLNEKSVAVNLFRFNYPDTLDLSSL